MNKQEVAAKLARKLLQEHVEKCIEEIGDETKGVMALDDSSSDGVLLILLKDENLVVTNEFVACCIDRPEALKFGKSLVRVYTPQ